MALVWKLVALPDRRTQQDGPDIIAFEQGVVFADTQAYDSATPAVILATGNFDFPSSMTNQQMLDAIATHYRRMKNASDRRSGLLSSVGQTFPIT